MVIFMLKNVCFVGMVICVFKCVIFNLIDCKLQLCVECECLVCNIGIEMWCMVQEWQCFFDLVFDVVECLLESLEWKCEEVDVLIVVIQFFDYLVLVIVIIFQDCLGLLYFIVVFDVNLGCLVYLFVFNLLGLLIVVGGVKKGFVLVGDCGVSVNDLIFFDVGIVMVLEFCEGVLLMYFDLNSDGSGYKVIILLVGGYCELVGVQYLMLFCEDENDYWYCVIDLQFDGIVVFSFFIQCVLLVVEKLFDYVGVSKDEVDYFVFYQVNWMINEIICKKFGLLVEKVFLILCDFGNISGVLLLVIMIVWINWEFEVGCNCVLFCGFGIGLFWGICLVDIEGVKFFDLIEF